MLDIDLHMTFADFELDLAGRSDARVLGLIGPSGSGKTTLLNCIAGTVTPDVGRIEVAGRTLLDTSQRGRNLPVAQRGIGYVFQDGLLFPHLSVEGNLRYGLGAHGVGPALSEVLAVLGLTPLLHRKVGTLSGGEARRVAIGRALLSAPKLLLLDEPLAGLDRLLAGRTLAYLRRVLTTFDIPALYVSHAISDVLFLCDEAWLLQRGKLIAAGPPKQILTQSAAQDDFQAADLENIFVARLDTTAPEDLTAYHLGEQRLIVAREHPSESPEAVLSIHATDIMLARTRPNRISARNVLAGRVTQIEPLGRHLLVFVDVSTEWMVRLTHRAVTELELQPGVEVFAIVKASAISVVETPASR